MNSKMHSTGKTKSIPAGMAISAAVSMTITVVLAAAIAYGLHVQRITWEQAGYWIMGMLFLASFAGGKSGYGAIKGQRCMISLLCGLLYWGLLLCVTALFFGGDYEGVWVTACIILAGSEASALLSIPNSGKRNRKKGRGNR